MSETIVERGAIAHPVITEVYDDSGFVSGLTVVQSVYDPEADEWMNMGTGAMQPTKDTAPKTETETGVFLRNIDITDVDPGTTKLLAISEITAGGSGPPDVEVLRIVENIDDLPTTTDIQSSVLSDGTPFAGASIAAILTDTGTTLPGTLSDMQGAGFDTGTDSLEAIRDNQGAGGTTPADVWAFAMTGGTAQELQELAGTGGVAPDVIADAVLDALLVDHRVEGSFGRAVGDMDATTLRLLLEAAVGKLTRLGHAYGSVTCFDFFVGDVGTIRVPILVDGQLADLTGAVIEWRFVNPETGTLVTHPGIISATPGHTEYVTSPGDGIVDAADVWRGQAIATLPSSDVHASEFVKVQVRATI